MASTSACDVVAAAPRATPSAAAWTTRPRVAVMLRSLPPLRFVEHWSISSMNTKPNTRLNPIKL